MTAVRWAAFAAQAPDLAEQGRNLWYRPNQGEVALFATVDTRGHPRIAPVSPICCGDGLYLSVGGHTPKLKHLEANGRYAMHGLVGADDLEFQISGPVRRVDADAERAEYPSRSSAVRSR